MMPHRWVVLALTLPGQVDKRVFLGVGQGFLDVLGNGRVFLGGLGPLVGECGPLGEEGEGRVEVLPGGGGGALGLRSFGRGEWSALLGVGLILGGPKHLDLRVFLLILGGEGRDRG